MFAFRPHVNGVFVYLEWSFFLKNSAYGFRADGRKRRFSAVSKTEKKNLLLPSKVALLLELRLY